MKREDLKRIIKGIILESVLKENSGGFTIPKQIQKLYPDFEGNLSNTKNWKGKVILANSGNLKKGDIDNVGYVLISKTSTDIVPVYRNDEHQTGYELLHYLYEKYKLPRGNYVSVYTLGGNYIYAESQNDIDEYVIVLRKALEYGINPKLEVNIRVNSQFMAKLLNMKYGVSFITTTKDFVEHNGDISEIKSSFKTQNRLTSYGEEIVDLLEKFAIKLKQRIKLQDSMRGTEKIDEDLIDIASDISRMIWITPLCDLKDKSGKELNTYKIDTENIDKAISTIMGFNGLKNAIHTQLKQKTKIKEYEDFFGSAKKALEEFNRISTI